MNLKPFFLPDAELFGVGSTFCASPAALHLFDSFNLHYQGLLRSHAYSAAVDVSSAWVTVPG